MKTFFFSSRRRHTRSLCDWSSDVCSSDLLTEAMTLTGAGGVIGVLLGVGISLLINATLPQLPSAVPLWAVVVGVLVAMSVGLFFGMYPAVKAARLDPVEALRYE